MEILAEKREEFQTAGYGLFWKIVPGHESHKVGTICAKPKHCKTRFVFPTKARNTEIPSGGFNDHFSGYWMYWLFMNFWLPGIKVFERPRPWVEVLIVCWSQGNSSTTKAKHYSESLRFSKQISNTLTGFTLQFLQKLFSESWHRSQSTNFF